MNEQETNQPPQAETKKPNETLSFHLSAGLKITDPETGEVLVQMRAE